MINLADKRCIPCEGGMPPLSYAEAAKLLAELNKTGGEWEMDIAAMHIQKSFKFKDFKEAMHFTNNVAQIAEMENHHPDLHVSWGKVVVELSTHAVRGLSENDFILAAKIDTINC